MPAKQPLRFRLTSDDDGHWYVIPEGMRGAFERLVKAATYWENYEGRDFNGDRINVPPHFTFTDPKED